MPPQVEPLSESDTRAKLITPALHSCGWTEDLIRREVTPGKIYKVGKDTRRGQKKLDYLLSLPPPQRGGRTLPIGLIEAKKSTDSPAAGMEQAKEYARKCKQFNVPYLYSSNGYQFVEYDSTTGRQSAPQPMASFPSPDELKRRYEEYLGVALQDPEAAPLHATESGKAGKRRYYQDAAIRSALEQLAYQEKHDEPQRALLNLATGSGKTFIAVNLLKQLDEAGKLRRALFLCDRDELRQQALAQFQAVFGNDVEMARRTSDGENLAQNARIHIATYQTLGIEVDEETEATFAAEHYPLEYFSHIIIDECHRSLRNDWAEILGSNSNGAHIGLTATVKQVQDNNAANDEDREISSRNIQYFGKPVYTYDLAQGAEDGYLALCEIHKSDVDIDDTGLSIEQVLLLNPINYNTGQPLTEEELRKWYENKDYENIIMLPDRVHVMCVDLFQKVIANNPNSDPLEKTIIFCVRREHAQLVAAKLNNLYAEWCEQNGKERAEPYAFVCMSAQGSENLSEFRTEDSHHFIAATVDLLTTGVDIPAVRNIAFFRYVKSPILLQQMIGRGARIDAGRKKYAFTVYDYTDATDLLDGSEWRPSIGGSGGSGGGGSEPPPPLAQIEGLEVHVSDSGSFIIVHDEETGSIKRMDVEEYRGELLRQLLEKVETIEDLRKIWVDPQQRSELLQRLRSENISIRALAGLVNMNEYDDYDIIAESGFGVLPMNRQQRTDAFLYKNDSWLQQLKPSVAAVVKAFVRQFANNGIEELENPEIFNTPELLQVGGFDALQQGSDEPRNVLDEAKRRLFVA